MSQPSASPPIIDSFSELRDWLAERSLRKILILCGPSRRFVGELSGALDGCDVEVFDEAMVHVPEATVDAAQAALDAVRPDVLVSLGGGSATGLGKALRLSHPALPFVAIPTTYAGSEMTRIYGVRRGHEKATGREDHVRPDLVVHRAELMVHMPLRLTVTSLMNALAHPISALSRGFGGVAEDDRTLATDAIRTLVTALRTLVQRPTHAAARADALRGVAAAGQVLDRVPLGAHHRLAHHFGGRLGADHAGLHAALLPHSVAALPPAVAELVSEAARTSDLAGLLYECLVRAGAAVGFRGLADAEPLREAVADLDAVDATPEERQAAVDAALGRDPSQRYERVPLTGPHDAALLNPNGAVRRVVVAVHGRGATSESIVAHARAILSDAPDVAVIAPQAPECAWYSKGYAAPPEAQGDALDHALAAVDVAVGWASDQVGRENVVLFGFSQGACLACEWLRRTDAPVSALVALSGAALGPAAAYGAPASDLSETRVVLTLAAGDPWVESADTRKTAEMFRAAGAEVAFHLAPGGPHAVDALDRVLARELLLGKPAPPCLPGFGAPHASEGLPGALPTAQNSPRHVPYGLYAEQLSGTGFVAPRHQNLRTWVYRIRPSAQQGPFEPLAHPTLNAAFDGPPEPNLCGWEPLPIPTEPMDFVDGLVTLGGAGSPELRRGYAVHLYAANRSMRERVFYDADGDWLLIPQQGDLILRTELGVLDLEPGQVAVIPRGLRFAVLLKGDSARGYVGQTFGRHFELPERGPIGANGLADARHFEAPVAAHEDRVSPGFRITARFGGALFEATQDFSPFDVVAWHGNYAPYRFDLRHFCPVSNTRFDHTDPSVYTVLTAPLDEPGSHGLDFVFFPPRWDPTEHTFRPPYFHRNVTTELNGIIADPSLGEDAPFTPGCTFLTPGMTPHGIVARGVEKALASRPEQTEAGHDMPHRISDGSMWFQFESALPFQLTPWARTAPPRITDWLHRWGTYTPHYNPVGGSTPVGGDRRAPV